MDEPIPQVLKQKYNSWWEISTTSAMTSCRTALALISYLSLKLPYEVGWVAFLHTPVSFACLNCSQKVFSYGTVWLKSPAACRVYPGIKHPPAAQYLQLLYWLLHASNICIQMILGTLLPGDHLST